MSTRVPGPPPLGVGDRVLGKLRIDGVVGEGGMATVYRAYHEVLAQMVALKVVRAGSDDKLVAERFLKEARLCALMRTEHVARVMDAGTLDTGAPYMIMELLEGETLFDRLGRGPLSVPAAVDVMLQAMEAIAEAHALGIVHRDIKPENLFVTAGDDGYERVKVLDFGISKIMESSAITLRGTKTGVVLGTPLYMCPEQLRSTKDVDARADVWSLGIVLYELVAGKAPFDREGQGAIFAAILEEEPVPLSTLLPEVPRAFSDAVASCLRKKREERCADVAELARAIEPFASPDRRTSASQVEVALRRARPTNSVPRLDAIVTGTAPTLLNGVTAQTLPPGRSPGRATTLGATADFAPAVRGTGWKKVVAGGVLGAAVCAVALLAFLGPARHPDAAASVAFANSAPAPSGTPAVAPSSSQSSPAAVVTTVGSASPPVGPLPKPSGAAASIHQPPKLNAPPPKPVASSQLTKDRYGW